jgi:hypothetical protein
VREHGGVAAPPSAPEQFPGGAALLTDEAVWVLVAEQPQRALGRALAWSERRDRVRVHVVVDDAAAAGTLARRAQQFTVPPQVWLASPDGLTAATPAAAPQIAEPDRRALALAPALRTAGAGVLVEDGLVLGDVLGLEVARVVVDAGDAKIATGVGRHDRDAFALVHGDHAPAEGLARVVATVRRHRRADGPDHPLRRLAAERWLRHVVVAVPSIAGAARLAPIDGTEPRAGVKDVVPAVAAGVDGTGRAVVVVTSVGADLDLVPAAADARAARSPEARLVLVVPERDDHAVTRRLAAALAEPADIVTVDAGWRAISA